MGKKVRLTVWVEEDQLQQLNNLGLGYGQKSVLVRNLINSLFEGVKQHGTQVLFSMLRPPEELELEAEPVEEEECD